MVDIFLSYAEQDRDAASRVASLLEHSGWTVWWDRGIPAGTKWRAAIADALGGMRLLVVLWSRNSVASEWVNEEAEQARIAGKLIPVLIDDVFPPLGFREFQCANLIGWDGSEDAQAFRKLILDIEAHLGSSRRQARAAASSGVAEDPAPADAGHVLRVRRGSTPTMSSPRRLVSLLILLLACVTGVIAAARMWIFTSDPVPAVVPSASPASATRLAVPEPRPPLSEERAKAPLPRQQSDETPASADKAQAQPPPQTSRKVRRTEASANPRCGNILSRLGLGDAVSDDDRQYLAKECR